jgi:hypothetical protein
MHTLHLRDDQIALGEKRPDLQLIGTGAAAQNASGQIDRGKRELGEQRGGDVDFPPARLHLDDAANDQVADFGRVARAQRLDREEFVGFLDGAGDGGDDGG